MSAKTQRMIGWILTTIIALFLMGPSALGKLLPWDGKQQMFDQLGISIHLIKQIAILEIIIAILYLIPKTTFLGAILITGYLGGAIFVHVRIHEPPIFQVVIAIFTWIGVAFRKPILWKLVMGKE